MTERDNTQRINAPSKVHPQVPAEGMDIFHLPVPTEVVELPSRGRYYPEDTPLHNLKEAEIRFMTATEEDILANPSYIKNGTSITRLLDNVLIEPANIDTLRLLIGDRNRLLVASRINAFGAEYKVGINCPACTTRTDHTFDLHKVNDVVGYTDDIGEIYGVSPSGPGTFKFTTPLQKVELEIRLLTGEDEKKLFDTNRTRRAKNLDEPVGIRDQMFRFIVSAMGVTDRGKIRHYINQCPSADTRHIKQVYQACEPSVNMYQDFTCSVCHNDTEVMVPLGAEFFWPR